MRLICIVAVAIVCLTSLIEARRYDRLRNRLDGESAFLPVRDPSENTLVAEYVNKYSYKLEKMTGLKFNKLEPTQYRLGPLMDRGERCVIYLIKIRAMEDGIEGEEDYEHWFHMQIRQDQNENTEYTDAYQTTEGSPLRPIKWNNQWKHWDTNDK